MAAAEGFTPAHLTGKTEACFAVVIRSLTWKLDPFAVAQSTYSPSPGKVGFEGKLCQAIIENSGMVVGGVTYEAFGDWSKVQGKFQKKTSDKGKAYLAATYTEKDKEGLGVIARAQVRGEKTPREYKLELRQAYPRNSTLWASDPLTQLKYRAARGLGNLAMPGIFMGVPFEPEDSEPLSHGTGTVATAAELNETYLAKPSIADEPPTIEHEEVVVPQETIKQGASRVPTAADIVNDAHAELEAAEAAKKAAAPADEVIVLNASTNYGLMSQEKLRQALKQACEDVAEYRDDPDAAAGYWASVNGKALAFSLGRKGMAAEKAKLDAAMSPKQPSAQ